jgi:hypothetical protein
MNYFAEKLIGLVLCTVFGFTVAIGAPSANLTPRYAPLPWHR